MLTLSHKQHVVSLCCYFAPNCCCLFSPHTDMLLLCQTLNTTFIDSHQVLWRFQIHQCKHQVVVEHVVVDAPGRATPSRSINISATPSVHRQRWRWQQYHRFLCSSSSSSSSSSISHHFLFILYKYENVYFKYTAAYMKIKVSKPQPRSCQRAVWMNGMFYESSKMAASSLSYFHIRMQKIYLSPLSADWHNEIISSLRMTCHYSHHIFITSLRCIYGGGRTQRRLPVVVVVWCTHS